MTRSRTRDASGSSSHGKAREQLTTVGRQPAGASAVHPLEMIGYAPFTWGRSAAYSDAAVARSVSRRRAHAWVMGWGSAENPATATAVTLPEDEGRISVGLNACRDPNPLAARSQRSPRGNRQAGRPSESPGKTRGEEGTPVSDAVTGFLRAWSVQVQHGVRLIPSSQPNVLATDRPRHAPPVAQASVTGLPLTRGRQSRSEHQKT